MSVVVVCLAGGTANLWKCKVDAEGERFIGEIRFELVNDLNICKQSEQIGCVYACALLVTALECSRDRRCSLHHLHLTLLLREDRPKS